MTLNVISCNDLAFIMFRTYKGAAVLSAFMKVYTVPCHDRGHITFMFILQSCTDPLHILPGSSREKYATPSDDACNSSSIDVEENVGEIEEDLTAINKEVDVGIKHEEFPADRNFFFIKVEPDEVSWMCVYVY